MRYILIYTILSPTVHQELWEVKDSISGVLIHPISCKVACLELALTKCLWMQFAIELLCHQSNFHHKLLEKWSKLPFSETWKWHNIFGEWFIENHVFHSDAKCTMIGKNFQISPQALVFKHQSSNQQILT